MRNYIDRAGQVWIDELDKRDKSKINIYVIFHSRSDDSHNNRIIHTANLHSHDGEVQQLFTVYEHTDDHNSFDTCDFLKRIVLGEIYDY